MGDNFPVGTILAFNGDVKDIPPKWHLCDGTNGTPNLLDGRFLEGSSTANNWHSAGVPNLKGTFQAAPYGSGNGVFSSTYPGWWGTQSGQSYRISYTNFNASIYSSVYKDDCTTVQPASYTVYYIIKIKK